MSISNILDNVVAGIILFVLGWVITKFTNIFTQYQIVIVNKKAWRAFKQVAPLIHDRVTASDVELKRQADKNREAIKKL